MKELIGKTIYAVHVSQGEDTIYFKINDGWLSYYAEGDCCSESWFADIIGFDVLVGSRVLSVETLDMPQEDQHRTRQDSDLVYGYAIVTIRGIATIAFRNSSNGYYGGWLCPVEDREPCNARQILDDWSA